MIISENKIPFILKIAILTYFIVAFNPDIRVHSMFWYIITVTTSLLMLSYLIAFKMLKPNRYVWWLVIFNLWCLISIYWALDQESTINSLKTAFAQMIIFIPLSMLIRNKDGLYEIIKLVVLAIIITSIYLIMNIDRSMIGPF